MKRRAELVGLSDDHHRALVLARRARVAAASDAQAIAAAWEAVRRAFDRDLAPHFAIEEIHLLPPVRRAGGEALARRVEDDHAALRDLALGEARDAAALAAFGERLHAHVRFEERELFPFAEARLTADELGACRRPGE